MTGLQVYTEFRIIFWDLPAVRICTRDDRKWGRTLVIMIEERTLRAMLAEIADEALFDQGRGLVQDLARDARRSWTDRPGLARVA